MVKVELNKDGTTVELPDRSPKGIYYDGYLLENLKVVKPLVAKDWDMVFLVDGDEGAGKSVFAQQVGAYLDPNLCAERVCFTPDTFKKAILSGREGQCIIYDDAYSGFSSRGSMSVINLMLVNLLTLIRQKRLYIIIVMPCFFELDKYPAIWRSICLFHVYAPKFVRGYFKFYSKDRKKDLYIKGKKFYNYGVPPDFKGRFCNGYYVDEAQYRAKKRKELENYNPWEFTGQFKFKKQRDSLMRFLREVKKWSYETIAEGTGYYLDEDTISIGGIKKMIQRERKREYLEKEAGIDD